MSKMKMAGKTPMCVQCRSFYSLKKMDEAQTALAHETGLCPKCQAELKQNDEVKSDVIQVVANETGVKVVDIELVSANPEDLKGIPVVAKAKDLKPAKRIKEIISGLVAAGQINDSMLNSLLDKQYALKSLGGVKYAFMKEVDVTQDIREQVMVAGKARYSTKVMEICGRNVVMTNDLYEKNLKAIEKWSEQFDLAKAV